MKELVINGLCLGMCKAYRTRNSGGPEEMGAWVFYMEAGYTITVEKIQIKYFESCGELRITLFPVAE